MQETTGQCPHCAGRGRVHDADALDAIGRAARSLARLGRALPRKRRVPASLAGLGDDDPRLDPRPIRRFLYIEEAPGLAAWWVEDGDKVRNRAGGWQRNPEGNDRRVRRMLVARRWPEQEDWPDP